MAAPVSISELIVIASQIKTAYDAFFSKDANSASQIKDLVDDINTFKDNLEEHKAATTKHNLTYSGYDSIQRTLDNCQRFLDDYKAVLKPKLSAAKVYRIAQFPYDLDRVDRLRKQIASHINNLIHFSVIFILSNSRVDEGPRHVATAQSLPDRLSSAVTPSHSPFLSSGSPASSYGYLSSSPTTEPIQTVSPLDKPRQTSVQSNPLKPIPGSLGPGRRDSDLSFSALPQPTLPYYAELFFGPKKDGRNASKVGLNRKPFGRDFNGGRELVIVNKKGNTTLTHQIKPSTKKNCYPYTWHSRWKSHQPFEVTFMDSNHSLIVKGIPVLPDVPCYVFINVEHYREFQGEVRGKDLVDFFEFDQIITAVNTGRGLLATDQHLKIWRDRTIPNYSISFYSNDATVDNDATVERHRDLEFPLGILGEKHSYEDLQVVLDFSIIEEFKRKISRASSRSLTNSPSITAYNSRKISKIISSGITSTTTTSRMSIASSSSGGGQLAVDQSKDDTRLIESAKRMRYLKIIFSNVDEATRFSALYSNIYSETLVQSDRITNWRFDSKARSESIGSSSGPLTPSSMSPDLGAKQE